jgi:hypothetical protein
MTDRLVQAELTRRALIGLGGIAGPLGAVAVARRFKADYQSADDLSKAVGRDRLATTPEEIVNLVTECPPGNLMLYSQLFWPIHQRSGHLAELDSLCRDAVTAHKQTGYQIRILPTLARIHAIGSTFDSERLKYESYVLSSLNAAVGKSNDRNLLVVGDREAAEHIWRTMIGALVRNKGAWSTFSVTSDLVEAAWQLVDRYLNGEEVWFNAALLAWQFLLTYERALSERNTDSTSVRAILSKVENEQRAGALWFATLSQLYRNRHTFDEIYPQFGEAFIAFRHSYFDPQFRDFAASVSLYKLYINSKLLDDQSEYVPTKRAKFYDDEWPNVVSHFGLTSNDWVRLNTPRLFSEAASKYLGDRLRQPLTQSASRLVSSLRYETLGLWVPFRKRDEERIFTYVHNNLPLEAVLKLFGNGSEDAMMEVWKSTIAFEGAALASQCDLANQDKNKIIKEAFEQIPDPDKTIAAFYTLSRALCEQGQDLLRKFVGGTAIVASIALSPEAVNSSEAAGEELPIPTVMEDTRVRLQARNLNGSSTVVSDRKASPDKTAGVSNSGGAIGDAPRTETSIEPPETEENLPDEVFDPDYETDWVRQFVSEFPEGWKAAVANIPCTVQTPDFNRVPLNGETPEDIRRRFGVEVLVLGNSRSRTRPYTIVISGATNAVSKYEEHLQSTW